MKLDIKHNTNEAFLEWYEPIHQPFIRYCNSKSLGLMSADDLAQESILACLSAFDKIQNKENLLGYLIGIVNNITKNQIRRKKFKGEWDEDLMTKVADQLQNPELALDVEYLYQCINQLNATEQEAILLFEISGFSIQEIASIQESSESAVKTRLHRSRKKLAKMVAEDESTVGMARRMVLLTSILW